MKKLAVICLILLILTSSAWGAPKNVILFIGDGMGFAHVAAARMIANSPNGRLHMDDMSVTGFVTTRSANSIITDSAAAATAYACGIKTNNGVLGETPDDARAKSLLEAARDLGKLTGLVTTKQITDATPAAFAAHVDSRVKQSDIAGELLASRANILMGGGMEYFIPKSRQGSKREDERDIIAEAAAKGYAVALNADELTKVSGSKILGLFALGTLTTTAPEPPLTELASKAIDVLSKNSNGFFLMVEGGQIDSYAHANNFEGMIRQLLEFDRAVARGLEFARKDKNTLVIVTADHETGGLTLLTEDKSQIKPSWSTKGHSGVVVPIYAFGPGSERFAGLMDNAQMGRAIADDINVKIGPQSGKYASNTPKTPLTLAK